MYIAYPNTSEYPGVTHKCPDASTSSDVPFIQHRVTVDVAAHTHTRVKSSQGNTNIYLPAPISLVLLRSNAVRWVRLPLVTSPSTSSLSTGHCIRWEWSTRLHRWTNPPTVAAISRSLDTQRAVIAVVHCIDAVVCTASRVHTLTNLRSKVAIYLYQYLYGISQRALLETCQASPHPHTRALFLQPEGVPCQTI